MVIPLRTVRVRGGRVLRWLLIDPWPVWLAILVPVVTLAASWFFVPGGAGFRVRLAGLGLTIAGVGLVVRGIVDTQRLFGRPTLRSRVKGWALRLPRILNPPPIDLAASVTASAHVTATLGGVEARGTVGAPSVEQRLSAAEADISRARREIEQLRTQHSTQIVALHSSYHLESTARAEADARLERKLEEFSVGGIDTELMGVVWFVAGEVLTTLTDEVARGLIVVLAAA